MVGPEKVEVYFNLHKHLWSVRSARSGLVTDHVRVVAFPFGADFIVRESGRQRCLREGRKNVHAFVKGSGHYAGNDVEDWRRAMTMPEDQRVTYNPRRAGYFHFAASGEPVHKATAVLMLAPEGHPPQVWAVPGLTLELQRQKFAEFVNSS